MHVYVDWVDADHWQVRFFDPIDPVDGFKEVANYRQSQHDDKRKRIKRGESQSLPIQKDILVSDKCLTNKMSLGSASWLAEAYQETHEEGALAENLGHIEFYFIRLCWTLYGSWNVGLFGFEKEVTLYPNFIYLGTYSLY